MPVDGRKTKIFVNEFDLSRFFKTAEVSGEAASIDSTTFDATTKTFIPDYVEGGFSLSGVWDSDQFHATQNPTGLSNEVDDVLQPILGAESNQLFLVGQEGADAIGLNCQLAQGKETKYSITSPTASLTSVAAEIKADGRIAQGLLLAHKVARIISGLGTAVDGVAASTAGAIAHLHLVAMSGTAAPSLTVIVEDSADGTSGWATIGTFTLLNAVGSQRLAINGTVRRFTRANWTITGTTPSFTFVTGLARN